jgi:hypothetical protein
MIIVEGTKQDDRATESVKQEIAGVKAFSEMAALRPIRLVHLAALLVAECLDPSTEPVTPVSFAFATVATRLDKEEASEPVRPIAPTTP